MNWWEYLTTSSSYFGSDGILAELAAHLGYSGLAIIVTCVLALPTGFVLGHWHRGRVLVQTIANLGRAVPAFGVVVLFGVSSLGISLFTLTITLVIFALPQVLGNAYVAVANCDSGSVQAARGIGMSEAQILFRVEIRSGMPLIASGIRSAAVQIVATATIAAYAGAGGLGAIIFRGLDDNITALQVGGAILVVLLALVVQGALGLVERRTTPKALRGRNRVRGRGVIGARN